MSDQSESPKPLQTKATSEVYDLVVVGAGIAGLNALYAAVEYLPKTARVLLIDQKDQPGGMWNTAYDYVRLHQPHPMFTVGDMTWDWHQPRDYLATRDEVQSHLARAVGHVAGKVDLHTRFGQTVTSCTEIERSGTPVAEVICHPNAAPGDVTILHATRAIYASGLNYKPATPLELSSTDVVSIIPQELCRTLQDHPDAPLYIVGGGKTGIDSILAALGQDANRRITLINGRGTNFLNRTKYLPTGLKRWTSGALVSRLFRDLTLNFDGDNEDHMIAHFRKNHAIDPTGENDVYLYGLQSEGEHSRIKEGCSDVLAGYLADVEESADTPRLVLRSGSMHPVIPGSIFVNCTGSFFRTDVLEEPYPFLSPHATVMAVNARTGMHFLSSVAGFFGTHLLYRGLLRGTGFYALDHEVLFRRNRNAWVGATAVQAYMNQVLAVQSLPMTLLDRCGLDFDRWYPLPRRVIGLIQMKSTAQTDIAHCRRVLDRVADRFDVHCSQIT